MVARSIGGSVMPSGSLNAWINKRRTAPPYTSPSNDGDNTNDQARAVKRQKTTSTMQQQQQQQQLVAVGQVAFPFYCANPAPMLMDTLMKEPLRDCWTCLDAFNVEQEANLTIFTVHDHQLVLENNVYLSSTLTATSSTTVGDCSTGVDKQLFVNLAKLYKLNVLTTLDMTLEPCNGQSSNTNNYVITLTFGADIDHRYTRKQLFLLLFPYLYPTSGECSFDGQIPIDEFYRHLQPPVSNTLLTKCQTPGLAPTLTPFQSQNVEWMVNREGLSILDDGSLQENTTRLPDQVPFLWERLVVTTSGQLLYINRVSGRILSSWTQELEEKRDKIYRGGILADEMGLGKTVSTIALILLNTFTTSTNIYNQINDAGLRKTGATLIVTPGTIIHQWASEFKRHAPGLQVSQYSGIKTIPDGVETRDYADTLASNDIVLTTYEVLKNEIHYARNLSARPRRHGIKHVARRSPLVQILWWRCVVDEAQQVESSLSNAAEMACLIPRYYSWGVTGTPLKASNYSDLYGLFVFLDQFGDINKTRFREMYISPGLQPAFMRFTQQIMRRNMKHLLQGQIHIPKQHRHVIKISFSTIEQHYYNDLHDMCRQEADPGWLDSIGWVKPASSSPDYTKYIDSTRALRKWLTTLRETCVYPAFLGKDSDEDVHSLGQVLDIMIQKSKDTIEEAQVLLANLKLRNGGMHELQLEGWDIPLMMYMEWLPHVEEQVKTHGTKVTEARHANELNRQQQSSNSGDSDSNKDSKILKALLAAHTTWQNILHRYYFYIAGVYHMLDNKEKEDEYYDKAADTRRQILARPQEKVRASVEEVEKVDHRLTSGGMVSFSPQKETLLLTDDFLTRVDDLTETMNRQMAVITEWRMLLKKFLASNLVDSSGGDDVKGDEYDNSLIIQEKCDIYQDIYQDILRDRHYWVNGVWQAPRVANLQEDNDTRYNDTQNEEIKCLREDLDQLRQKLAPSNGTSLRELLARLRELASGQNTMHKVEQHLIQAELTRLAREFKQQKDVQDALEAEYRKLSNLANHRIEYYRALQQISDHVGIWECQYPHVEIEELNYKMAMLQDRIAEQSSRQRYLENIAKEKQGQKEGDANEQDLFCLICNEHFTTGIVTHCGHLYCDVCAHTWFRTSHRCPQCSATVRRKDCYSISWSVATIQQDEQVQPAAENNSSAGLTTSALREIEKVSIQTGLGAKLDNVIRHIKYIQQTNNGKCLVFSQWNRLLGLMSKGLTKNGLGHVNLTVKKTDNSIERFRTDPDINVMLLHARSHSSGLTLLEAKTVFIIEPVLNESLEKQAIGRVHRIGQTEETSVFWYIVRDTIEERIQAIHSAKQRHRHTNNNLEIESAVVTPLTSLSEGGGEYVTDEDLQKCFTQK